MEKLSVHRWRCFCRFGLQERGDWRSGSPMKKGNTAAHYSVNIFLVSFLPFRWPIPMLKQLISLGANFVDLIGRPYGFCRLNGCWCQGAARVWLILHLRTVTGQICPACSLVMCDIFQLENAPLCAQNNSFSSTCHRCTFLHS
jgi:hypothetical protein